MVLYLVLEENASTGFAHLKVSLDQGSTIKDLLEQIGIPTEERGFTFINGNLSALLNFNRTFRRFCRMAIESLSST